MDEIILDDKKYISSKRAAKLTGYAKDYVGQLCREGRVQARLVGRSWYVLESAIQDHRFGASKEAPEIDETSKQDTEAPATWAPLRYEASVDEALPPVQRHIHAVEEVEVTQAVQTSPEQSWDAWFDLVAKETSPSKVEQVESAVEEVQVETREEIETIERVEALEEAPVVRASERPTKAPQRRRGIRRAQIAFMFIRLVGVLLAASAATFAVANSGYFDTKVGSFGRVEEIIGVRTYNK